MGGLLNLAVKAAVGRDRPDLPEPVSHAPGFAFPSGHAMGSAIGVSVLLFVLLPLLAPRWRRPAVAMGTLFAVTVGLSRIVLGVHWVSDVLGGWLLSVAWVLAMVAGFRAWQLSGTCLICQRRIRLASSAGGRLTSRTDCPEGWT